MEGAILEQIFQDINQGQICTAGGGGCEEIFLQVCIFKDIEIFGKLDPTLVFVCLDKLEWIDVNIEPVLSTKLHTPSIGTVLFAQIQLGHYDFSITNALWFEEAKISKLSNPEYTKKFDASTTYNEFTISRAKCISWQSKCPDFAWTQIQIDILDHTQADKGNGHVSNWMILMMIWKVAKRNSCQHENQERDIVSNQSTTSPGKVSGIGNQQLDRKKPLQITPRSVANQLQLVFEGLVILPLSHGNHAL
ncbi:hypothetical protein EV363DRAFT_1297749 [Boletus edulis]|nr:hypothetical protein EV363DRAFT_1297749 [Boletus edulis]